MTNKGIFVALIAVAVVAFYFVRQRSILLAKSSNKSLGSLPRHYGYLGAVGTLLPSLAIFLSWLLFGPSLVEMLVIADIRPELLARFGHNPDLVLNRILLAKNSTANIETDPDILRAATAYEFLYVRGIWSAFGLSVSIALLSAWRQIQKTQIHMQARAKIERFLLRMLAISSSVAILVTMGIFASLLVESLRFFQHVPLDDFLFGTHWSPQTALRTDQVGASGSFGALPLFAGTLLIAVLALIVAGPVGLMSAIYLNQYASKKTRNIVKPLLEILSGVPTVVYGYFAAITVAPSFRLLGNMVGLDIAAESALAAGVVMGIMIIPYVSSLSDDAITAVPKSLREGSLALGATESETILRVILPAALPGIVSSFLLAISRAIGETMIVVMAAGLRPNITANPLESVTTVTAQIVALLTGDQEFDSTKTLSAFALGLVLFFATLFLNIIALVFVRRYREVYQ